MTAAQRRETILHMLENASAPLPAAALAKSCAVSRQIIVGDIALLRAGGTAIQATPRGYLLEREQGGYVRPVACVHTAGDMERELELMVDHGCTVVDVMVDHPVYGQLSAALSLSSRYDVAEFIRKVSECDAKPLSLLTEGVHLHTLRCPDQAVYDRVTAALDKAGFLVESGTH